jgi:ribonuclease PH
MAISPKSNDVLLLQMDGGLDKDQLKQAMNMVVEAGKIISKAQRDALKAIYENR